MHPAAVMKRTNQAHKPVITATFGFLLPVFVDNIFIRIGFFSHLLTLHMGLVLTTVCFNSIVLHEIIVLFLGQPLYLWESESRSAARTTVYMEDCNEPILDLPHW